MTEVGAGYSTRSRLLPASPLCSGSSSSKRPLALSSWKSAPPVSAKRPAITCIAPASNNLAPRKIYSCEPLSAPSNCSSCRRYAAFSLSIWQLSMGIYICCSLRLVECISRIIIGSRTYRVSHIWESGWACSQVGGNRHTSFSWIAS